MVCVWLSALLILCALNSLSSISVHEGTKKELSGSHDALADHNDFHCDLNLMPSQKKLMYYEYRLQRKDSSYDVYKWPKNQEGLVIVPFRISKSSLYTSHQYSLIRAAMDAIEAVTCIRFKDRKYEKDYVNIYSGQYCKSNLGRTGGAQEMSLNTFKCFQKGIIIHEFLHALGFIHMQSRPDRDKYVKILWQNIDPKFAREFDKVNPGVFNYYGTGYDYHSVMHYGSKAASKNGGRTIVTKDNQYLDAIGQRNGLSDGDIQRINTKYKCKVYKPTVNLFANYDHRILGSKEPDVDQFKPISSPFIHTSTKDDDDDEDLFNI